MYIHFSGVSSNLLVERIRTGNKNTPRASNKGGKEGSGAHGYPYTEPDPRAEQ